MGRGMEVITGFVTAPGATLTALTMAAGNSLTIRSAKEGSKIWLVTCWADVQATGILQITSPRLHDASRGIRFATVASEPLPLLPLEQMQPLFSTDTLVASLSGSATAGDIETASLLVWYDDLQGVEGRFISPDDFAKRRVNTFTTENTISTGTAGGYSGEEAVTAEADFWKANTDYALLGAQCNIECATIRVRGSDTGNLGVGIPGSETQKHVTANWFCRLSKASGMPLIPVFNSNNRSGILLDVAQDENGADPIVTLLWAQLG